MASRVLEALELQVAEVEMLSSMYPNNSEFTLDDPTSLDLIKAVIAGDLNLEALESRLGFTMHISCSEKGKVLNVNLMCQMPYEYPFVKPQVFIHTSDSLNRERLKCLHEDLSKEVANQEEGDIIIGVLVEWLKERLYQELVYVGDKPKDKSSDEKKALGPGKDSFTRLWIYSHHIYSKIKRKDIQDWGTELKLNGFCMPGKPGIICAEGFSSDVDEFWYRIRRMTWKKICIKEQEVIPLLKGKEVASLNKFDPFFELVLDARGGKGREYHMDLGQFNTYLHQHGSSSIFGLFFGLEGKIEDDDDVGS